jgi:hypothetical protein
MLYIRDGVKILDSPPEVSLSRRIKRTMTTLMINQEILRKRYIIYLY